MPTRTSRPAPRWHGAKATVLVLVAVALGACQRAYYGAMEQFGVHKRDILVDRVEAARDEQEGARAEFQSALEAFNSVVSFDGGDLRSLYDRLNDALQECRGRAESVGERIDSIESVSDALVDEWRAELEQYSSPELRRRSEEALLRTEERAAQLVETMRRAEARMQPVLAAFNDQVLFLKHNLNAQAVASLQGEAATIEADVRTLVAEMNAAIAEADAFIAGMRDGTSG